MSEHLRRALALLLSAALISAVSLPPAYAGGPRAAPDAPAGGAKAALTSQPATRTHNDPLARPISDIQPLATPQTPQPAASGSAAAPQAAQPAPAALAAALGPDASAAPSAAAPDASVESGPLGSKVGALLRDPFGDTKREPGVAAPALRPAASLSSGPSLRVKRALTAVVVTLPFVGFASAMTYFWGHGFDALQMGIMLSMLAATELGITVGYHRLFTHRSFETTPRVRAAFAVLGSMAVEGPVMDWVALHRIHHRFSDKPGDPHSPHLHGSGFWGTLKGLGYAHMGWFFNKDPDNLHRNVPDLAADPVLSRVNRQFPFWILAGLIIPTLAGGLLSWSWNGAWLGLFWGGGARLFLLHHITWSINSICHLWGARPFRSTDLSRNNPVFGLLAFGEGWHNNHHAFPRSARHGLFWWQLDVSYLVILALEKLGLAWNVQVPAADEQAAKRQD